MRFLLLVVLTLASCSSTPPDRTSDEQRVAGPLPCRVQPHGQEAVRWVEAPTEKDRELNAHWCGAVGPPVVAAHATGTAAGIDSLAVMSWNVYIGGGDLLLVVEGLRSGEFTGGRPVENFVLLLQEAYREGDAVPLDIEPKYFANANHPSPPSGDRIDIVQVAETLGLDLFYVPSMRNGRPGKEPAEEDKGNAILSTLPLSEFTAIELPFEINRRVAVAATVAGRNAEGVPWKLRVASAHLDHFSRFSRLYEAGGGGRRRQAEALVDAIPESPGVLGADLNTWGSRYMETALEALRSAFPQPDSLDSSITSVRRFLPDKRIDYLLFRLPEPCKGTYTRLDERFGSDHFPLLGWIECNTD